MSNLKGCYLHESDHWETPKFIYDYYVKLNKSYDPCPLHGEEKKDGLKENWPMGNIFINPPYSQIEKWVDKAIEELKNGYLYRKIIMLLPVRTDTKWFKKIMNQNPTITFISKRLHFNESKQNAPFPSMIIELHKISIMTFTFIKDRDEMKKEYETYITKFERNKI